MSTKSTTLLCGREGCEFATELFAAAATRADNEIARREAVIKAQAEALAEWRRKSDEDAGRLGRYYRALFEIAFSNLYPISDYESAYREAQSRAKRELEGEVVRP